MSPSFGNFHLGTWSVNVSLCLSQALCCAGGCSPLSCVPALKEAGGEERKEIDNHSTKWGSTQSADLHWVLRKGCHARLGGMERAGNSKSCLEKEASGGELWISCQGLVLRTLVSTEIVCKFFCVLCAFTFLQRVHDFYCILRSLRPPLFRYFD